ncbi:MAG: flagellar basal body rod protein FlgC [Lachnospiraceae bacterium]|nr:flagellar basal body rod protein FlgC [Lachnospiraceae bacterium]
MSLFSSFDVSASGLTAQQYRMDVIAENIANANTTRTQDGTPYVRKMVTFEQKGRGATFRDTLSKAREEYVGGGVKVTNVIEDTETEMIKAYDPSHPDADENGYVWYPNVNIVTEMTDLIDASRSFEANATAFNASKSIAQRGLDIIQ